MLHHLKRQANRVYVDQQVFGYHFDIRDIFTRIAKELGIKYKAVSPKKES